MTLKKESYINKVRNFSRPIYILRFQYLSFLEIRVDGFNTICCKKISIFRTCKTLWVCEISAIGAGFLVIGLKVKSDGLVANGYIVILKALQSDSI